MTTTFDETFRDLTGKDPFPWQKEMFRRFMSGDLPESCNLPTGLGKTSIIAIWLIALARESEKVPRRLVYVVNRRTVVDQTTTEVERLKAKLPTLNVWFTDLAISTLRGQHADNRKWSADPSRPAVIVGTVDMIGSRLLFGGYGVGFKARPLHAGFLGQDALLVHDEAHLEPAFQKLLLSVLKEQREGRTPDFLPFRVMELSATSRGGENGVGDTADIPFELTTEDKNDPRVRQRLESKKQIVLHEIKDPKKLADQVADLALLHKESGRAILVFVRTVEDVLKVRDRLAKEKQSVEMLTGTLRGRERDQLVEKPIFQRFLPDAAPADETVYLVCTSAGEVGVNISADHMICDLSTFESMAQRFGRVNRFGDRDDTRIDIVHPIEFDSEKEYELRRAKTLELMKRLGGDGSPANLGGLELKERMAAFTPEPKYLETSDILFDTWAHTSIRKKIPGRPPIEPFLHGIAEWEPPDTHVAWRVEVGLLDEELRGTNPPKELLEDFPLKPHELLREPSYRAFKHFESLAQRHPDAPVWLIDEDGGVFPLTLKGLANKSKKEQIEGKTVVFPPSVGGLEGGMLNGNSTNATDIADTDQRMRLWSNDVNLEEKSKGMRLIRQIIVRPPNEDEEDEGKTWFWFETPTGDGDGSQSAKKSVTWKVHVADVVNRTEEIVKGLPSSISESIRQAVIVAAKFHDHGKRRKLFQTILGNHGYPVKEALAKSGKLRGRVTETYRHEFGSLVDIESESEFQALTDEMKELVLHLIATHHGRGRPHFSSEEAFDPECQNGLHVAQIAAATPGRFARLQRRYGRWGLAYLESLLRAGDWLASATPSAYVEDSK